MQVKQVFPGCRDVTGRSLDGFQRMQSASKTTDLKEIRAQLVDLGGRTAQDFGVGRVLGQVLALLYFTNGELSLDEIEEELALSKAAVSIATRDLEKLGLLRRVWKPNDRKSYYRTVDNLGVALQQGVHLQLKRSLMEIETVLDGIDEEIQGNKVRTDAESELQFFKSRVKRASMIRARFEKFLNSPLIRFIAK